MGGNEELPDGFITLPPGLADSITIREPAPRTVRPAADEIVFFAGTGPVASPPPPNGPAEQVVAPPSHAAPPTRRWRLRLPDGASIVLETTALLGRNPGPDQRFPGAQLIPVPDPGKSISKTHAALEVQADGLWVHDLDSTNGVWVAEPDNEATEVRPGLRTEVQPGWNLELGSVSIAVIFE